ncbi:MAG: protein-export chaperone SecB [Alistipes sp.]|nr:protein-export chaperone SecB [Alistipes sp.]
METPAFMPIKTFLKEVVFESPNTPDLFFNAESAANLEISIDVQSRVAEGTSLYLVELHTSLTPKITERVVFNLKLIYSTLVEIADQELEDETRKHLLTVIVPQSMYNPLRALVWKLTLESGFPPIMMNDYDFATHQANTDIRPFDNHEVSFDKNEDNDNSFAFLKFLNEQEKDEESAIEEGSESPQENIFPLGYEWIMEDIRLVEDGAGASFLETAKNYLEKDGKSTGDELLTYEENPLYKYYYRFLTPIEYSHPDYEECEDSYWPMLFQLLFGEGKNVKIIDGENGIPEIEFDYCEDERRTVSSLTLEELKFITSELAVKAFTDTLVEILGYDKQMDNDYADILRDDQLILKEEFHALYNTDQPDASDEDIAFVDKLYARIKECDLQTFPYKF